MQNALEQILSNIPRTHFQRVLRAHFSVKHVLKEIVNKVEFMAYSRPKKKLLMKKIPRNYRATNCATRVAMVDP